MSHWSLFSDSNVGCWMKHPLERLLKKLVPYD